MNISEIKSEPAYKHKPIHKRNGYVDYPVKMEKLIEEKWIKNWIDRSRDEYLKSNLLKEGGALIRIRFNHETGEIYEMMTHQSTGHLCYMFYRDPGEWDGLRNIIEEGKHE